MSLSSRLFKNLRRAGPSNMRKESRAFSSPSSNSAASSGDYCSNLVKQYDFDNYLAGLIVPKEFRETYFAIRAFNVEIAMIKDQCHGNTMAGRIRFQWWRDVLEEIYSPEVKKKSRLISNQPVANALYDCIKHSDMNMNLRWFERSLDARQRDLASEQPQTMDDLENYAEQSNSSILYLLLESMGVHEENAEYAASHIGVCSGISTYYNT